MIHIVLTYIGNRGRMAARMVLFKHGLIKMENTPKHILHSSKN